MPTMTDTDALSFSFAAPEAFQEAAQKAVNFWVGAASPLWAPFWAAASVGVGVWTVSQGFTRTLGGTLYDRDLPLVVKWPGFMAPPAPERLTEATVEALEAPVELAEQAASPVVEAVEAVAETVGTSVIEAAESAVEAVSEPAKVVAEASEDTISAFEPAKVIEAEEKAEEAVSQVVAETDETAVAAAEAITKAEPVVEETRPLIDPVTEVPVIPAVAKALAEPKLPMPNPRKTRKR